MLIGLTERESRMWPVLDSIGRQVCGAHQLTNPRTAAFIVTDYMRVFCDAHDKLTKLGVTGSELMEFWAKIAKREGRMT